MFSHNDHRVAIMLYSSRSLHCTLNLCNGDIGVIVAKLWHIPGDPWAVLNHNSYLKSCLYHNSDIPWVLFRSPFNTICLKSCLYHNSITSPIFQFYYSKMSKAIYRDGGKTYSTLCRILAKVNSHQSPPPPPHTHPKPSRILTCRDWFSMFILDF